MIVKFTARAIRTSSEEFGISVNFADDPIDPCLSLAITRDERCSATEKQQGFDIPYLRIMSKNMSIDWGDYGCIKSCVASPREIELELSAAAARELNGIATIVIDINCLEKEVDSLFDDIQRVLSTTVSFRRSLET